MRALALLLLFASGVHAATITINGATLDGVKFRLPATDWSGCASLVAYWKLDETGTNDRVPYSGSCPTSDCTLTNINGVTNVTGIRGQAVASNGGSKYVKCDDTDCDELDFTSDFTIVNTFQPGSLFGNWRSVSKGAFGTRGYFLRHDIFLTANNPDFAVGTTSIGTPVSTLSAGEWNFAAAYFDDTNDDINQYISSETTGWSKGTDGTLTSLSGTTDQFRVAQASTTLTQGYVDELSAWGIVLTEAEACRICSCYVDGEGCVRDGTGYIDTGWNDTICGSCTLPDSNAACPA